MEQLILININHYIILSFIIFVIGLSGVFLNRKNIIVILMSIELILLSVNINFVAFSAFFQDMVGQIFSIFVLTIAAAEAAIGLTLVVLVFRNNKTVEVDQLVNLKD